MSTWLPDCCLAALLLGWLFRLLATGARSLARLEVVGRLMPVGL